MNKRKTLLLAALAGAVMVILWLVAFWLPAPSVQWPNFPQPAGSEPQVVVVVDPDFGYHIGDVVPVDIFIRQPAGTKVEDGLALEGDFETRGDPVVTREVRGADTYIRMRVYLQSFQAFKPAYQATISMTYEKVGDKEIREVQAPPITVGTSNTWDGRDQPQTGKLAPWYGNHLVFNIAYLVVGVVGLIGLTVYIRRLRKLIPKPTKPKVPLTPRQKAKARFDVVWKKIRAGDQSERNFREIDVIVRQLERIEHVLLEHVPMAIGDSHPRKEAIMHILGSCELVIFRGDSLTDEQLDAFEAMFLVFIGAAPTTPTSDPSTAADKSES